MSTISFHNFMFPFRWKINGLDDRPFSEQVNLENIRYALSSNWERMSKPIVEEEKDGLYNERNYFYEFVHPALYDDGSPQTLVRHYERREPKHGDVTIILYVDVTMMSIYLTYNPLISTSMPLEWVFSLSTSTITAIQKLRMCWLSTNMVGEYSLPLSPMSMVGMKLPIASLLKVLMEYMVKIFANTPTRHQAIILQHLSAKW